MSSLRNILRRGDTKDESDDSSEDEQGGDTSNKVTVEITESVVKRHTVHLAEATFIDGDTIPFMFDGMKEDSNSIRLFDYTEYSKYRNSKEVFVTIPHDNLKTFETIRREEVETEVAENVETKHISEDCLEEKVRYHRNRDGVKSVEVGEKQ